MYLKEHRFIRSILAVTVTVMLLLSTMTMASLAVAAPTPDTGSITVQNVAENDTFAAYKVLDISYDAGTNTLSYAWNAQVPSSISVTPEQFAAMTDESQRQEVFGVLANAISTPAASVTAGAAQTAVFDNLAWGGYLIIPTRTTSVYSVMLGVIQPKAVNGEWTVNSPAIGAKKSDGPVLTKNVSEPTAGKWTTLTYTIDFSVPTYDGTVVDNTLTLTDTAPATLTNAADLHLFGIDGATTTELTIGNVVNNPDTIMSAAANAFTLDFIYDQVKTYDSLRITYTQQLTDTAPLNTALTNQADLTYSNYPYVANSHKTISDTAEVKTFGIKVFKNDAAAQTVGLPNAVFSVYRAAETGETGIDVSGLTGVVSAGTITTGTDGYGTFDRVKYGTYYLVETKAPSGYKTISAPVTVQVADNTVDNAGYATVNISNTAGFSLPQTGGVGTVLFTAFGTLLMAGAIVVLILFCRKKSKTDK